MTHDYTVSLIHLVIFWLSTVATCIGATIYILHWIYFRPLDKPSRGRHAKKARFESNPLKLRIPKAPQPATKPMSPPPAPSGPVSLTLKRMDDRTQIMYSVVPGSDHKTTFIPRIKEETNVAS